MGNKLKISKKPSRLWYLVPIILSFIHPVLAIIVGIIGYLFFKNKHPKFAKWFLIISFIVVVIWSVLLVTLASLAYIFISDIMTSKMASIISVVDTSCGDGTITTVISNVGTESVSVSSLEFFINGQKTMPSECSGSIEPHSTVVCNIGSDLSGSQRVEIKDPSNTVTQSVWC